MNETSITQTPFFSFTIHEINWERVNIHLEGLISGKVDERYTPYLLNKSNNVKIPIRNFMQNKHLLSLTINVTSLNNEDRIPDGSWDLIIEDSYKNIKRVQLASELFSQGENHFKNTYSKHFKSGPKRTYNICATLNNDDTLFFDVKFDFPPPKFLEKKNKSTFKKQLFILRSSIYDYIFNLAKKYIKKNGKRVLFTSASRESIGGNLEAVYNRMIERGLDKEYKLKKVFKSNIWARSKLLDKIKLPFYLGICDKILIEDYQPMVNKMDYDKDTEIIQLWHANGAFKTFGYSRLGKPASPKIDATNHRIYTKAITSSKHVKPFYAEAFAIDERKVKATGVPKTDIFFNDDYRSSKRENVLKSYPQLRNANKVILFGPTFRGGGPKNAYYPMHKIDFKPLADHCRENNTIIIFKMHFLVKNDLKIPDEFNDVFINATNYREINDLLFVADLLITDYSSTIYEYSLLNKPMLFYAYDLEEYISSRDFYDDFEGFVPGKIVRNFNDLLLALENEDYEFEKVEAFRKLNFEYLDGGASDRVIDWLILDSKEETLS